GPASNAPLFGLAPCGVFPARPVTRTAVRSYRTFSPLPPPVSRQFGGVFSVALSLGSPPLAVSQHTALGVRTFLPGRRRPRRPPGPLCERTSLGLGRPVIKEVAAAASPRAG